MMLPRRIATLREAFKNTPKWLGFNIELKYPTEAQLAAMPFRFYSRNYFVDSILKVCTPPPSASEQFVATRMSGKSAGAVFDFPPGDLTACATCFFVVWQHGELDQACGTVVTAVVHLHRVAFEAIKLPSCRVY